MESTEMIKKMATTCKVLNNILRDDQKFDELKRKYDKLEKKGKMPPKKGKKVKTETKKVEDKMKATMKKLEKFDAEDFIENSAAFTTIEDSLGSPPTHLLFYILRPCLFYVLFLHFFFFCMVF